MPTQETLRKVTEAITKFNRSEQGLGTEVYRKGAGGIVALTAGVMLEEQHPNIDPTQEREIASQLIANINASQPDTNA